MAKKKKASASRKPSGRSKTARKTTSRKTATRKTATRNTAKRKTTTRRKTATSRGAGPGELRLSAFRRQLERVIRRMDRDPGHDPKTREIFMSWTEDIDDICHPDNPDGCGPIMVFPEG